MSQSDTDETILAGKSHSQIQDIIHSVWEVRSTTIRALAQADASDLPRTHKAELHSMAFTYYDVLRPYFRHHLRLAQSEGDSSGNANQYLVELWSNKPVIPTEPLEINFLTCPECGWKARETQAEINRADPCPECDLFGLERLTRTHPDKQNAVALRHAEQFILDVQQRTQRRTGFRGSRTETRTHTQLLPATVLINITRLLDEAARELGFLPVGKEDDSRSAIIRDFDQSGESGQASYGTAKFNGDPDL